MEKRLTLSDQRVLGRVCSGIAVYFAIAPTVVRVVYAALTIFNAVCGLILYPILTWDIARMDQLV